MGKPAVYQKSIPQKKKASPKKWWIQRIFSNIKLRIQNLWESLTAKKPRKAPVAPKAPIAPKAPVAAKKPVSMLKFAAQQEAPIVKLDSDYDYNPPPEYKKKSPQKTKLTAEQKQKRTQREAQYQSRVKARFNDKTGVAHPYSIEEESGPILPFSVLPAIPVIQPAPELSDSSVLEVILDSSDIEANNKERELKKKALVVSSPPVDEQPLILVKPQDVELTSRMEPAIPLGNIKMDPELSDNSPLEVILSSSEDGAKPNDANNQSIEAIANNPLEDKPQVLAELAIEPSTVLLPHNKNEQALFIPEPIVASIPESVPVSMVAKSPAVFPMALAGQGVELPEPALESKQALVAPPPGIMSWLYATARDAAVNTVTSIGAMGADAIRMNFSLNHDTMEYVIYQAVSNPVYGYGAGTKLVYDARDYSVDRDDPRKMVAVYGAGCAVDYAGSYAAGSQAVALYKRLVGEVELYPHYALVAQTFHSCRQLPADLQLLQQGITHIFQGLPAQMINDMGQSVSATLKDASALGFLLPPMPHAAKALEVVANSSVKGINAGQYAVQGQYRGRILQAIDLLQVEGLPSLETMNNMGHLYQAYLDLSVAIPKLYAHYEVLSKARTGIPAACTAVVEAVKNGPMKQDFITWWNQPSDFQMPACVEESFKLCQALVGLCIQKVQEIEPYVQVMRQEIRSQINPELLAKQLVYAAVNMTTHQIKTQAAESVERGVRHSVDGVLNTVLYDAIIGSATGVVQQAMPAALARGAQALKVAPNNMMKAMGIFDKPLKADFIAGVQNMLQGLDQKLNTFLAVGLDKQEKAKFVHDLKVTGKCFAFCMVQGGVEIMSPAGVAISTVLTLPMIVNRVTSVLTEQMLSKKLNTESVQQNIVFVQDTLAAIIKYCLDTNHNIAEQLPEIALENNVVPPGAVVLVNNTQYLAQSKAMGQQLASVLNHNVPEYLNKMGADMGIQGDITEGIIMPQTITQKASAGLSAVARGLGLV